MRVFDSKELERRVDEVLFYVWDPIGVSGQPYARAEYENYVAQILGLVEKSDDPEPISSRLASIARESMGLTPDKKRCDHVAALLLQHKRAVNEGCA